MSTRQGIFLRRPVGSRVYLEKSHLTALAPASARGVELKVWGNESPAADRRRRVSMDFSKHTL